MSFNDDFTLLDLEQIRNSREYIDELPFGPGAESGCDFNEDFNNVLSAIKRIIVGGSGVAGNWYDNPAASIAELAAVSGQSSDIPCIDQFIGRTPPACDPTYANAFNITQSGNLTQAIGELDAIINNLVMSSGTSLTAAYVAGSGILDMGMTQFPTFNIQMASGNKVEFNNAVGAETLMEVCREGTVNDSRVLIRSLGEREFIDFSSTIAAGSTVTIPNSKLYTLGDKGTGYYPNMDVYYNGQRMSPGSGLVSGDEQRRDYVELTTGSIRTNRRLRATAGRPARLEFRIYG